MSQRRRRTTVGSISIPELPWHVHVEAEIDVTSRQQRAERLAESNQVDVVPGRTWPPPDYCEQPDHDQYGCDCTGPFDCT